MVAAVEQQVFLEEGVDLPAFQNYLRSRNLALVFTRNSTRRDQADPQQPFNLKVAWPASTTQTLGASGKIYDIGWVQIMQADALRGLTMDGALPIAGRRCWIVSSTLTVQESPFQSWLYSYFGSLANSTSFQSIPMVTAFPMELSMPLI